MHDDYSKQVLAHLITHTPMRMARQYLGAVVTAYHAAVDVRVDDSVVWETAASVQCATDSTLRDRLR